jgi:RING-box protein 1
MADVNMTDAPAPKAKAAKAGASGDSGEKKRFEVKKVGLSRKTDPELD